ncbi:PREDICTED: DNA repair protein XRCC2, partial [Ceratosolen solmsi marchali]|uniref:DNA repair protein XRCC2 n=1 Tax=Ceratosolen solmsi marchali TaxID=326594 RepID=A0AAJ6YHB6_9HYME
MNTELVIESGLQVIGRLIDRPSVQDLDNDLFFNKLENTDIIEIKGTISSGVSILLSKLIAKCILPLQYNGLGVEVLFINTENQFQMSNLYNVVRSNVCDFHGPINVDNLVKEMLNNLKIINCYNHSQFLLILNSLDNILLKYKGIGFIIVDSISAYYWQQKDYLSYDLYLIKMLNSIKKKTIDFKVVILYTKQFNFESKKKTVYWYEESKIIRYKICLTKNENSNELICDIKSGNDKKQLHYKI